MKEGNKNQQQEEDKDPYRQNEHQEGTKNKDPSFLEIARGTRHHGGRRNH